MIEPPKGTGRPLLAPTPTEVLSCSILVQGTRPIPERSPLPSLQLDFFTRKGMINVDFWSVDSTSIAFFPFPRETFRRSCALNQQNPSMPVNVLFGREGETETDRIQII
jgi:hypothetical protein